MLASIAPSIATTIVILVLIVAAGLYCKYTNERTKRLHLEDGTNRRKLCDFEKEFKKKEENKNKRGHYLAMCYYDDGVRYLLFVDEDCTVKQVLEREGIYTEVTKYDWYVSEFNGRSTDFYPLNDGFDWYIDCDKLYYATLGKPKKKRK